MSNIDNNKPESVTSGKDFTDTYPITEDIIEEPIIELVQATFPLCEADFLRINNRFQDFDSWVLVIFSASIGAAILYLAKLFQANVLGDTLKIEIWEWLGPLGGLLLSLVLFIIYRVQPTEKKRLTKKLKTYFDNAPRRKQLRKR